MRYTVLLEKVTEEDKESVSVSAESLEEAIQKAKEETGQSVVEVVEDFLDEQ
jgi:hypothetical protein